jgi:acetyl esterase/lipase
MSRNLCECLDYELKGPVTRMMSMPMNISFENIAAARNAPRPMMQNPPVIKGVISEDRMAPGPQGAPAVPVRIYRPEKEKGVLPALLWMHGGGYMFGNIEQEDLLAKQFTLGGNCITASVEYRLAPENPFPAPLEDCYAALKWLAAHASELKIDPSRIAIGGASAGGGLASGLALLARDRAEVNLIFQMLVYPMMDDRNINPASDSLPETILWTRKNNLLGWRAYLGCEPGGKELSCYAAASRALDLKGLPPAYITVGDLDLFAQEDIEFARKLIVASVPTELHVYPGACHAFDMMVPDADISKRFNADIHRALRRALHAGGK